MDITKNIENSDSTNESRNILNDVIDNKYKSHIEDWLFYAKPNEKKGLYILSKVVKHKGEKMFRHQLKKEKNEEIDTKSLTMAEAYKRYQKKKVQSNYTEQYGANMDDKYKYNNILKYKDFEHLSYAELIRKDYHSYIKNWIEMEQTEQYKEYLLDFLRSFMSTVRANRKFVTHKNEEFRNPKRHDKFSIHAVYGQKGNEMRLEQRQPSLEDLHAKLESLKRNETLDEKVNHEAVSDRKKELIAGARNILKGIYNNTSTSVYQDQYKGVQPKHHINFKPDIYSSGIKGVVPDPLIVARIKENNDINDNLKNKIKTMLFSGN